MMHVVFRFLLGSLKFKENQAIVNRKFDGFLLGIVHTKVDKVQAW